MKVFQAIHSYKPYLSHFENKYKINKEAISFVELKQLLIHDRFYATHLLEPVLNGEADGFYSMWDYPLLQKKWAESKGWKETDVKKILYAQIEEFKPDVFYNFSASRFVKEELQQNIAEGIIRICWHAAPQSKEIDFSSYSTRLSSIPPEVRDSLASGNRNDLFHPAHDPVMEEVRARTEKKVDIFFYGQYQSAHFKSRNEMIDKLLSYKSMSEYQVDVALQIKRVYKYYFPFSRPASIRKMFGRKLVFPALSVIENSIAPLYGLDLYEKIASSRIVFNADADFSGKYKINMRNFEVLGLGAHLFSEQGIYPTGFSDGEHFTSYLNFDDFLKKAEYMLSARSESERIAKAGNEMVRSQYSKQNQWEWFQKIVASI